MIFLIVLMSVASSISLRDMLCVTAGVCVLIGGTVGTTTLTAVAASGVSVELSGIHLASNATRNLSQ